MTLKKQTMYFVAAPLVPFHIRSKVYVPEHILFLFASESRVKAVSLWLFEGPELLPIGCLLIRRGLRHSLTDQSGQLGHIPIVFVWRKLQLSLGGVT